MTEARISVCAEGAPEEHCLPRPVSAVQGAGLRPGVGESGSSHL